MTESFSPTHISPSDVLRNIARHIVAKSVPYADLSSEKVIITDIDAVPDEVWAKYSRAMVAQRYEYRGVEDAKMLTKKSLRDGKVTLSGDHAEAFRHAIGTKDIHDPKGTPKGILQKAVKTFGITMNPQKAGYILQDGQLLNLSERAERELDHRSIERVFGGDKTWTDAMLDFMAMGNIRLECTDILLSFDIRTRPTASQYETMRRLLRESDEADVIVDAAGFHKEFPRRGTGVDDLIVNSIQSAF